MTADEVDRRTRAELLRLEAGGAHLSLSVAQALVAIGYGPKTAWRLVESVLLDGWRRP